MRVRGIYDDINVVSAEKFCIVRISVAAVLVFCAFSALFGFFDNSGNVKIFVFGTLEIQTVNIASAASLTDNGNIQLFIHYKSLRSKNQCLFQISAALSASQ